MIGVSEVEAVDKRPQRFHKRQTVYFNAFAAGSQFSPDPMRLVSRGFVVNRPDCDHAVCRIYQELNILGVSKLVKR